MIIANPIYDIVFKYLMEDIEIAKGLLSAILKEEIVSMEVKPQESAAEVVTHAVPLAIIRFDFKAIIKQKDGAYVKVLIELQKARHLLDIMRFRKYLGDNYGKEDTITDTNGNIISEPLRIISLYLLGFKISDRYPAVSKIKGVVEDVVSGQTLLERPKEPFVDLLTHESYVIQIPRLKNTMQTEVERVLSIFDQKYRSEDDVHQMNYQIAVTDPLIKRMLDRLNRASANAELRKQMDLEDEADRVISRLLREQDAKAEKLLAEKDQIITEKDQVITEKDQVITEKDKLIAELLEKLKNQP